MGYALRRLNHKVEPEIQRHAQKLSTRAVVESGFAKEVYL